MRSLFGDLPYLAIDSALARLTPATVAADDDTAPHTAVLRFGHTTIVAGEASDDSIAAVRRLLRKVDPPLLLLVGAPAWRPHLAGILPEREVHAVPRMYYRLDAAQQEWRTTAPDGIRLRPVDAELLADEALTNLDWVREEMLSERASITDFLEKSFGWCAVHDTEVVAWCMSEYNCGPRCELGIATAEAWRRTGLAQLTATSAIGDARRRGIHDIGWSCRADNVASIRTAEALGFVRVYEDTAYVLRRREDQ